MDNNEWRYVTSINISHQFTVETYSCANNVRIKFIVNLNSIQYVIYQQYFNCPAQEIDHPAPETNCSATKSTVRPQRPTKCPVSRYWP